MHKKQLFRIALILLALAATLAAQSTNSTLQGTVVDSTAGAVAGATVVLASDATAVRLAVHSGNDGLFRFPTVPAGRYSLTVEAKGFKGYKQDGIELATSETRDLGRLALEVGSLKEVITVEASTAAVQTASSEKSALVSGGELNNISLKGRDFFGLMYTLPGIVDDGSQARDTTSPNAIGGIYIAGGRSNAKDFRVDGILNIDTGSNGTIHYEPNMDAVAEVRVLSSNYQAEFGRSGGGTISMITKGGSQDFHASGWWTHRHEQFNANSFFNNKAGMPITPYRINVAGYTIGGPVYIPKHFNQDKSKFFFFYSQEYTNQRAIVWNGALSRVPSALERTGDFSNSLDTSGKLITVKDPTTGTPFAGNLIPAARLSAIGQSMMNIFPLPNYPAGGNSYNYYVSSSGAHPRRNDVVRGDVYLTSKLSGYFRYINDYDDQLVNNAYVTNVAGPWVDHPNPGHGYGAHLTYTFSPTVVNEFVFGKSLNSWDWYIVDSSTIDRGKYPNVPGLYPIAKQANTANYIPQVLFGGTPANTAAYGSFSNLPYHNQNDIWSYSDSIGISRGAHNIRAGIYIERTGKLQSTGTNYLGTFNFATDSNNPYDSGNAFANAALGNYTSFTQASGRNVMHPWFWDIEWFVQDSWRVHKRLTLDIGIRFYHVTPQVDTNHNIAYFDSSAYSAAKVPLLYRPTLNSSGKRVGMDPRTGALYPAAYIGLFVPGTGDTANGMKVVGKDGGLPGMYTVDPLGFGPRVGFAWDVFGTAKTAIRGGIGMFHDTPQGNPTMNAGPNPPLIYTPTVYYGNITDLNSGGGLVGPSNVTYMSGNQHFERTISYSLGVQQQVPFNLVVDLSYVGSISRHLLWTRNVNSVAMYSQFAAANQDVNGKPLPDNFFRPYMGYGNLILNEYAGTSNYNSFQFAANRRLSKGLLVTFSYTYSKALGAAPTDTWQVTQYFSPRKWSYGPLTFDRRQVASLTYSYDLPARKTNKVLSALVNGWNLSGVMRFQTGALITPSFTTTDSANITGSSISTTTNYGDNPRPVLTCNPNDYSSGWSYTSTFNTACFGRPAAGTFGTQGVGILVGPGIQNWDTSITKKIPIGLGENRVLKLKVDAFNVLNHPQFNAVNSVARFNPQGQQTDSTFGAYTGTLTNSARMLSLGLRFAF